VHNAALAVAAAAALETDEIDSAVQFLSLPASCVAVSADVGIAAELHIHLAHGLVPAQVS